MINDTPSKQYECLSLVTILLWSILAAGCALYKETQLTSTPQGHTLNSGQCFSPDDNWIVYDTRNEDTQIGTTATIAMVNVHNKAIKTLYQTTHPTPFGPGVGAATFSPVKNRVLFIHGIRDANQQQPYGITRRTGVAINIDSPFQPIYMDARNIVSPFTPGALRGGTHAYSWSGDGQWISFTYNDAIMEQRHDDRRTVGVMFPQKVTVPENGTRENNNGEMFAVIVTAVTSHPQPGSDEIGKAFDEGWIGTHGYQLPDGRWQERAIAFQGNVRDQQDSTKTEIFVVDLPPDVTKAAPAQPLQGTALTRPGIPADVHQRRITFTTAGVQGPRHWLRSTPDGKLIIFLSRDTAGFINAFGVSPNGGAIQPLTFHAFDIQSGINVSPDGKYLAYVAHNAVFITNIATHQTTQLTAARSTYKLYGAVIWSHNGKTLAYNRYVPDKTNAPYLQIFSLRLR